ncbi:MAG: RHS repeat-associated core domain-containing protein [Sphingomonadaceae bacterium]
MQLPATPTSQRYTGQREESARGLYFYGARWYDPALGRFIQPDTIVPQPGDAADWDRFAYVRNNPERST